MLPLLAASVARCNASRMMLCAVCVDIASDAVQCAYCVPTQKTWEAARANHGAVRRCVFTIVVPAKSAATGRIGYTAVIRGFHCASVDRSLAPAAVEQFASGSATAVM